MKKTITGILAATLAISVCASCGTKNKGELGKIELSIGGWPAVEGTSLQNKEEQKANFEAENENITIVPDTWSFDLKTFYPKAEAGLLPDLFVTHFTEIDKLIDGEYVADLTDVLKENDYYDKMNENVREIVSKDGKVYSIPTDVYCIGIVYNTDMFEAAGLVEADGTAKQPATWEELAEFAVKIKEATGKPGLALTTTNNVGGWLFTNIAWAYGVDFMKQDADGNWKATFNTPEMIEALQYVSDLKWKYDVIPANILIDQVEQQKIYATGGAAMILSAPIADRLSKYDMNPKMYGMMPVPAGPKKHVSLLGGTLNCVSSDADEGDAEAAIKWLDFIGNGIRCDDTVKANMEKSYETKVSKNMPIGVRSLSTWNSASEMVAYTNQLIEKNYNMKPNAARLYNEALENTEIELQAEEPVCAQDLYGILDNCLQQVLNNKDANLAKIVETANSEFQTNFLDNIDY